MRTRHLAASFLLALAGPACAGPFEISADGHEVTDGASGLVWRRCAEGMLWNGGECAGAALMTSFDKARAHARSQAADSKKAWRVPALGELFKLVDKKRGVPALDPKAFPNTPAMPFWTSTENAKDTHRAHFVFFATGQSYEEVRELPLHVRLVRSK